MFLCWLCCFYRISATEQLAATLDVLFRDQVIQANQFTFSVLAPLIFRFSGGRILFDLRCTHFGLLFFDGWILLLRNSLMIGRGGSSGCHICLVSRRQVIQSAALRKNRTSGIRHLAESIRDVGAADHCESVSAGLHKWRFYELWPLLCSSQCVAVALASDRVTAIKIIPKATSSTR